MSAYVHDEPDQDEVSAVPPDSEEEQGVGDQVKSRIADPDAHQCDRT